MMRKKTAAFLFLMITCFISVGSLAEVGLSYGQSQLESILTAYAGKEMALSDQLQIVQNHVNLRETPGGKVLGRLQGGTVLDCLDETQYKGELWYRVRSAEHGEGYVICTFAKPLWNNLNWWPLSETENVISDNMVLFMYWMGTYQLDHGLSVIETADMERQLNVAPLTVRGNESLIPEDMKIMLVTKLFEYGFICKNDSYEKLMDPSFIGNKNEIAVSVLRKHYGTDDIWSIITKPTVLFIHVNDLHARPEGPTSDRDQMLEYAVMRRIIAEHDADEKSGNEPADIRISAAVRSSYPDDQIFYCAPIGTDGTEYIVLTRNSADKAAVMIVNTGPSSSGVAFCNRRMMEGIPLDKDKVRIMDHLSDGHPYVWYTNTDSPDFLYVVFRKSEKGKWLVYEAQFGDDWHEFYSFRYHAEDQKIHVFLAGNDLIALSGDAIECNAESFDPAAVRQFLREILEPYV